MNLSEILKKNEKKLGNSKILVRKPEISRKDRPYSEFLLPPITSATSNNDVAGVNKKEAPTIQINNHEQKQPENIITIPKIIEDKPQPRSDDISEIFNTINNEYINLAGNEKRFMDYICDASIKTNDLEVGPIGIKEIIEEIGIKEKSIKQTINRLKHKGFLKKSSKRGKGGWRIFKLDLNILNSYQEIMKKKESNYILQQNSLNTTGFKDLSSTFKVFSGLPKEWEDLDISGLDNFGFTKNHLIQLYQDICSLKDEFGKETLTISSIQHSIYCFRWDLQNCYNELKERYTSPIKMFIGALRKGRPYNSIRPETFKSPDQIEWELYRQQIEKKNAMLEQIKQQAFSIEFEVWCGSLSEEETQDILPEETKKGLSSLSSTIKVRIIKNALLSYFEKYIWPNHCKKILSNQK